MVQRREQALPPVISELGAVRGELGRARDLCRAWAQSLGLRRTAQVAGFAKHVLEALAHQVAPELRLSQEAPKGAEVLDSAALGLARAIGMQAGRLPLTEALHFATSLYPTLLPERERSAMGAFYTPPALVTRLLDRASEEGIDWRTAQVLDPAAGAGAFIIQAAIRMRDAMGECEPAMVLRSVGARLVGLELDSNAAQLAQGSLEVVFADLLEKSGRPLASVVRVCDTLSQEPTERYDLVVGNPPYGRVKLSVDQRRTYARSLFGHANLYGIFTDVALRWAKPGAVIAFLTPTSFLAGQYYGALRELLAREAPPVGIDFVHARRGVFEDVLQETLLATYRKGGSRVRAQIHYLNVINEREATVTKNGTVALPIDTSAPWLAPRDPQHVALIAQVEKMPTRLADWGYSVSTGPLVWNRFKPQLRYKVGAANVHPLIWAECVTADGRFLFRAEKRNHAPYFKLGDKDAWLLVDTPCVLVQRTTAKEQARRLIAAELPKAFIKRHRGVVVENHLNMVRSLGETDVPAAVVAAILNSRTADEVFRCMNGSVAVSAFELEALPLPAAKELGNLKRLVARGASKGTIEAECDRLYSGAP
jgi:adenine-specific DNA-methyltransferase